MALPTPFIGRRKELAELQRWFGDVQAGHATIALISGELGIGKTRLVDEFLLRARENDGALFGEGRWYDSREMPPYLGFTEALWPLVSNPAVCSALESSGPHRRELARLGPEFANALSIQIGDDSRDEQFGLWRAVAELLRAASSICPVVIALDDIQWADKGSLGLLAFLGGEVQSHRVMFVATFRSEGLPSDHALNAVIADLVRAEVLKTMYLGGLSLSEVGELAGGIASGVVGSGFIDTLHRETRGNPLFVSELVHDLVDAQANDQTTSIWDSDLRAPEPLQQVMVRRLSTMSPACRCVLDSASVLGREFQVTVIEDMAGLSRDALLQAIDEAIAGNMIDQVTAGSFVFHHPIVRGIVRSALTASGLMQTHQKAAQALIAHYGANAPHHAREIAGHLVASGGLAAPGETATYCLAGARQLRALFAFEESSRLLYHGLAAIERMEHSVRLRAEILIELGYAQTALGQPEEALQTYREALRLYLDLGDGAAVTDARRWIAATLARYGRWTEVLEVTEEALAEAPEERSYAYVGLVGSHAMAATVAAQLGEAARWVPKLLELAFDDPTRAVAHHVAACWHSYGGGEPGQATEHFARSRELFLRAGQDATAAGVSLDHAIVAHFLGDVEVGRDAEDAAEKLSTRTGRVAALADLHALRSIVHVQSGRWEEAQQERELWRAGASQLGGRTVYGQLAERAEALEVLWRKGPTEAGRFLVTTSPLRNEPLRAVLAVEAGNYDEARQLVDAIISVVPNDGRGLFWLSIALAVTSVLCSLEDERAAEWYEGLQRHEGAIFAWFSVDAELARIDAAAGGWAKSDARFRATADSLGKRGLMLLRADALVQHARMLRRRRHAGDRVEAERLLAAADEAFASADAPYAQNKIDVLLRTHGPGRPPSGGKGGLTARELAVLGLLATGKSTKEIARDLVLSERTVSRHLENIYSKMGVSSRTAAVARAVREGLVDSGTEMKE